LQSAKEKLENNFEDWNCIACIGFSEQICKDSDVFLSKNSTAALLTGDETFFDQLHEHFVSLNIDILQNLQEI
jgi:hypothetical protein